MRPSKNSGRQEATQSAKAAAKWIVSVLTQAWAWTSSLNIPEDRWEESKQQPVCLGRHRSSRSSLKRDRAPFEKELSTTQAKKAKHDLWEASASMRYGDTKRSRGCLQSSAPLQDEQGKDDYEPEGQARVWLNHFAKMGAGAACDPLKLAEATARRQS